jgi:hypothetical protein
MNDIPDWVVRYGPNRGSDELRKLFANMMQNTWLIYKMNQGFSVLLILIV